MKNKHTIVFLLTLVVSTNSFCCLMATQERIIPIGTSENCLIGIEIISNRYGEIEEVWNYKFKLKGFNEDYSEFLIEELSLEDGIKNDEVEEVIKDRIKKSLQLCEELDDFEILEPKDISFCDFKKNCSKLRLIESNEKLKFKIENEKKYYDVHYLSSDYGGDIAKPYKEYFEFYFNDEIIGTDLKISSIRQYENSFYKLLIFHLGTGQEFDETTTGKLHQKKETKLDKELRTIEDVIFKEPILHHGKGFDYFRISKK